MTGASSALHYCRTPQVIDRYLRAVYGRGERVWCTGAEAEVTVLALDDVMVPRTAEYVAGVMGGERLLDVAREGAKRISGV